MSKVMFFSIPAHGHTNPTIGVVEALVRRGHTVRYFSFDEFRDKLEAAGAEYVTCDAFLPPAPDDLAQKVGRDFASLIEMVADTTIRMDAMVKEQIDAFAPDVIISDSVCFWGKLFAKKYHVPFICSTTTFAFNRHTAKLMKQSVGEILRMFTGMPRINAKMAQLRAKGYAVTDFVSIIQNDNDTNTIVYTSKLFQPMADTFSEHYAFIGPSVAQAPYPKRSKERPQVYISLGTVLSNNLQFYQHCVDALGELACDVIISAGRQTDIGSLRGVPPSIRVFPYVNQMEVLANTDVFLSHCGMNSVNESLYMGVPMVLFPQHAEEYAVAVQAQALGAGVRIRRGTVKEIRRAVTQVLGNSGYRAAAERIRDDFRRCGGAEMAADFIEQVIAGGQRP